MTARRHAAAHVFVEDVSRPRIDEGDRHHLLRVLRIRPGQTVTVADGRGSWTPCVLTEKHELQPLSDQIHTEQAEERPITVAFGVTKSDKPEAVVQKLTEIGVDHIVPVLLEHSVVRWDSDKANHHLERFRRISREAAMQSRQVFLPTIHPVATDLGDLLSSAVMEGQWGTVAAADPQGDADLVDISAMVIGPEGGFSSQELEMFDSSVNLVGGILRAETAAVAAGVLLAHSRSHR